MTFAIRQFHPSDLPALYRICLQTGDNGGDATRLFRDPELLGHFYAAPYAVLEPDLCFILTRDGQPCGYVLGTRDSEAFDRATATQWFPVLRERYALPAAEDQSPDAYIIGRIHDGRHANPDAVGYPAHLHIDILPDGQGQGRGRALMDTFLQRLRTLAVPGVHLGVGIENQRAIAFYERIGFERLREYEWGFLLGMQLSH